MSEEYVHSPRSQSGRNGPIKIPVTDVNLEAGHWMTWLSTGSPLNSTAPDPFVYATVPAPHQTLDGTTSLHATHLTCHLADLYGGCAANFWPVERSATAVDGASDVDVTKPISYDLRWDGLECL